MGKEADEGMIRYRCDKCGASIGANDPNRYIVKLEVYAAAGPVELSFEPGEEPGKELSRLLDALAESDPDDLEDKTYRLFRFDVCDPCRRKLLQRPLGG
jgi:hypothetical protein